MIPKQALEIRQDKAELIVFRETSDALVEGRYHGTFVKNGTGDYTITLRKPSRRTICVVGVSPLVANLQHRIVAVSASAVQVSFTNNSGTAVDTDFHMSVVRFDSDLER